MKEVNKKGMSPLIVTIILVGFTLVLSTGIFMWTQDSVVGNQIDSIPENWRGAEYLQFSASFSSACDNVNATANTYFHIYPPDNLSAGTYNTTMTITLS